MGEPTAEDDGKAAVPAARCAGEEQCAGSYPLVKNHFARVLVRRLRTAHILPPSSPAFRILMVGSSISMFGSRISTVAFPMLVLHLNNSPLATGIVAFAAIVPSMLIYVPAGVLVDRWNPRRVMLASELLRGLAIASVVVSLAIFHDSISIWFLIPAMVLEEIFEIFFTLADRRYLSRLMERDNMAPRQAYAEVRSHAAVLAGRPIGPFLFTIRPFLPFLADATSFLFSIGSLAVLRRDDEPARKPRRVPPKQVAKDIEQGFTWLKKDRQAFLTVILMAATSLVAQALILMFLSEAHSKRLSTVAIGIVLAASGAGGAIGAIFSRFLPTKVKGFWLPIQMVAWSVALAFLALAGGLSVFWCATTMLILGVTGAIGNINFCSYLVSRVTDDMIAKVTGIGQMLAIGACALGPVLGGATVQHFGVQGAIKFLFIIVVLLVPLSLRTPEVAQKLTEIHQSISRTLSFNRSSEVASDEMAPDSWPEGANRVDLPGDELAAAGCRPEQNPDTGGHLVLEHVAVLPAQKNSRPLSISLNEALTCEDAAR